MEETTKQSDYPDKHPDSYMITLDWDMDHSGFKESVSWKILKQWVRTNRKYTVLKVESRKSSHQNVHIRLFIERKDDHTISQIEEYMIRSHLRDDSDRIRLDLQRLYFNKETNRLWDAKITKDEILEASDWKIETLW